MALFCSEKLSPLLRGIISKNNCDFYCLNCIHSRRTKEELEYCKKECEKKNKKFCGLIMPSKDSKIFEFNQHLKSDQIPSTIHTDLESLIQKIDGCKNNFVKFNVYNMDI